MPFIQRCLEPINVSRVEVEKGIKNELECVTNHTLGNIILQLSSLSKHAEDMFTELSQEVVTFTNRTRQLQGRIDHLQEKVTRLDAAGELVSILDIQQKKPYKSSSQHDQQVVSRSTIPRCILKAYSQGDATPALDKLNPYREDGRDSVKFYTDPGYFFELWFQDIQKDIENRKTELKAKRKKRPQKASEKKKVPRKVETRAERFKDMKHGVELSDYADPAKLKIQNNQPRPESLEVNTRHQDNIYNDQRGSRPPNGPHYSQDVSRQSNINIENNNYITQTGNHQLQHVQNQLSPKQGRLSNMSHRGSSGSIGATRPSQPPPAPPPFLGNAAHQSPARDSLPPPPPPPPAENNDPRRYQPNPEITRIPSTHRPSPSRQEVDLLPPPPPPPLSPEQNLPPPPPPPPINSEVAPPPPPPPPPPPMPLTNGVDDESSSNGSGSIKMELTTSPKLKPTPKQPAMLDDRSNLLAQIRMGTHKEKLRKVEEREQERSNKSAPGSNFDVHSIMNRAFEMRRKVIEESEEEDGSSDDEWD